MTWTGPIKQPKNKPLKYSHAQVDEMIKLVDEMVQDTNPLLFTKPPESYYYNRLKVQRIIKEIKNYE